MIVVWLDRVRRRDIDAALHDGGLPRSAVRSHPTGAGAERRQLFRRRRRDSRHRRGVRQRETDPGTDRRRTGDGRFRRGDGERPPLLSGGVGLSAHDLDGPFPEDLDSNAGKSRLALFKDLSRREGLSIRQLYKRIAAGRGHWSAKGTAADVAGQMEEWFARGAADGFNILAPYFPGGLSRFAALVVPELQRRGLFRTAYERSTFRETLGLGL